MKKEKLEKKKNDSDLQACFVTSQLDSHHRRAQPASKIKEDGHHHRESGIVEMTMHFV